MATKLTLKNGQWFEIKDTLKVRDTRDVHSYSVDGMATDGLTYRFNVVKHQIATAAVRILRWGLEEDGNPIAWPAGRPFKDRVEAVEGLDQKVFEEMSAALSAHLKSVEEDEDAEKNDETPAGVTT